MKFVGVTACPTGIAHSAMAAEALETKAKEMGHEMEIEIHGASGAEFVEPQVIKDADAVIIASDATVSERNRFDGKPTVEVRLREAMDKPGEVIERAMGPPKRAPPGLPPPRTTPPRRRRPKTRPCRPTSAVRGGAPRSGAGS